MQAIVADLEAAGYLTRTRTGRRTRYTVNPDSPFRHPAQDGLRVGPFLAGWPSGDAAEPGPAAGPAAALPRQPPATTALDRAPRSWALSLTPLVGWFRRCGPWEADRGPAGAGVTGRRGRRLSGKQA